MIPKIIHYCWFGGKPLPPLALKCIDSWEKYLPSYEIKEWNESNFDIHCCRYVEEAYCAKKWAFVSDYVRLYVLHKNGGIYMDTDVEVLKSLDRFLVHPAFSGFENDTNIPTGIIGSEKNNPWVGELLSYYDNKGFINQDGSYDVTTNVTTITRMTKEKYAFIPNNTFQELGMDVVIYPKEFFCPKNYQTGKVMLTDNTYTIHHFNGSWVSKKQKLIIGIRRLVGEKIWHILRTVKRRIFNHGE